MDMIGAADGAQTLRLEGVEKRFGPVTALHPLDLTVPAGRLVALLGPSGCGKTTTLRIVAGLERPDAGRVYLNDVDITDVPCNRRGLGMVFQNYALFPHMTVARNVGFGLRITGAARGEVDRRVREALGLVRLAGLDERLPSMLSGGQQQRVALARSLVTRPKVLLLDEPLGALDRNLRERMQFELRQLQRSLGITTILVTHDQEEALTMSDMIVVMNQGRIAQVGSPEEVYDRPRTRFVAEFLGAANVFRCVADGTARSARPLGAGGEALPFHIRLGAEAPARPSFLVAVRPERTWIGEEAPGPDRSVLRGSLVGHVFRGGYHAYEVSVPGLAGPVYAHAQHDGSTGSRFPVGGEVYLSWSPESSILLEDDAD
ncbi:MAG TPA: ABC transporter ATP-binding protein [Thermodesulfobacteriota bacterium]